MYIDSRQLILIRERRSDYRKMFTVEVRFGKLVVRANSCLSVSVGSGKESKKTGRRSVIDAMT